MKIVLASQSPRRKQLLEEEGIECIIHPSKTLEVFEPSVSIDEALETVAYQKAVDVADLYPEYVTLAADTIVLFNGQRLGKPKDAKQAYSYLQALSGNSHEVKTGVCFIKGQNIHTFVDTTEVHFRTLSSFEIKQYVNSGRCMDKAGAYGIQECDFVEWIDGSLTNVIGLPMERVRLFMKKYA